MLFSDTEVNISAIYAIHRQVEDDKFRSDIDNKKLLFHASSPQNFVGILSR